MPLHRRTILTLAVASLLAFVTSAMAAERAGDMTLGNPEAKVTVIEYASITCPHCAQFHMDVFPAFKAKYIDSGQVRFIFREFPTQPANVAIAGFLVARCAGSERYFSVIDALFRGQAAMYESGDGTKFLTDGAAAGGMDEAALRACLQDQAGLEALQSRVQHTVEVDLIEGTPTFVIGETRLVGNQPLGRLDAVLQPLIAP